MKDSLIEHFRTRFQGHEAAVDPATWQVIEARLIAAGSPSDPVNDLFRARFQGHEADVDPAVWKGISARLGHPAAAGGAAAGGWAWWAAGIAGMAAAGAVAVLLLRGPDAPQQRPVATEPVTVDEPSPAAMPAAQADAGQPKEAAPAPSA
ncbi:MAG: hypothetical protein ACK4L7_10085, partial [Flavobacteriales bacterium]